jgi:saccharopine dehydrogenase (NADP+, L-glutamate forming)
MQHILVIGAGRSATALINYLLDNAAENKWFVSVADASPEAAAQKVNGNPNGRGIWLDVMKDNDRRDLIGRADIVVSLLPAHLHLPVAADCLKLKKHLVTASYVSRQIYELHDDARNKALIFMGEMGLDPGIDHMSAMQKIDEIRAKGGKLLSFKSYAGGLVSPDSDDNPWHYKFSWSPKNVILAGQGTAQYKFEDKYKYIPYNRLFKNIEQIDIPNMGVYEAYANRDSLLYVSHYKLEDCPTILRATLRYKGYCDAWNVFVQLGLTDDSYPILASNELTYRELIEAYLHESQGKGMNVRERLAEFIGQPVDSEVMKKLEWLGIFDNTKIGLENASPAQILQHLLERKWVMKPNDKDMVIMHHKFEYELKGKIHHATSTLVIHGEDSVNTAMSKLVGLPLGIFVKLVLQGKIQERGVLIPTSQEVYEPVLEELKTFGVTFFEEG